MKDKIKAILDSKTFWTSFGVAAGTLLGDKAAAIVHGLGVLVQAIIVI